MAGRVVPLTTSEQALADAAAAFLAQPSLADPRVAPMTKPSRG